MRKRFSSPWLTLFRCVPFRLSPCFHPGVRLWQLPWGLRARVRLSGCRGSGWEDVHASPGDPWVSACHSPGAATRFSLGSSSIPCKPRLAAALLYFVSAHHSGRHLLLAGSGKSSSGFVSTVYQACKRVGRQPSSFSGFWITRGGSTRCPQNPAYPVATLQSAWRPARETWLLGSVSSSAGSLPGLIKTELLRILAPAPRPGCLSRGTRGRHRALGGVLAKPFSPHGRRPELELGAATRSLAPLSIPPAFLPWAAGWEQVKVRPYCTELGI